MKRTSFNTFERIYGKQLAGNSRYYFDVITLSQSPAVLGVLSQSEAATTLHNLAPAKSFGGSPILVWPADLE